MSVTSQAKALAMKELRLEKRLLCRPCDLIRRELRFPEPQLRLDLTGDEDHERGCNGGDGGSQPLGAAKRAGAAGNRDGLHRVRSPCPDGHSGVGFRNVREHRREN